MTTQISHFDQQELFLTTKLQPPSSIQRLVSRPRLLELIDQGLEGKLTLLCAPAGSGKTTLFADWLHSPHGHDVPCAWRPSRILCNWYAELASQRWITQKTRWCPMREIMIQHASGAISVLL